MGNRTGTLVVSARAAIKHDGVVEEVSDAGVTIVTREFGRQTKVEKFYPWASVIASSDEGPGFVVVTEDEPVAVYHGVVDTKGGLVSVTTASGRIISAASNGNVTYSIIYDGEDGKPSTTLGKHGFRESSRFDTKSEREGEKSKPAKKAKTSKKVTKKGKVR